MKSTCEAIRAEIKIPRAIVFTGVLSVVFIYGDLCNNNINAFTAIGLTLISIGLLNGLCLGIYLILSDSCKLEPLFISLDNVVCNIVITLACVLLGILFHNGWITELLVRFIFK